MSYHEIAQGKEIMNFINMKRLAVISLITPLFLTGVAGAFAEESPSPTKSAFHDQMIQHKMNMDKFDQDMGTFRESMTARMQIRQNINLTFKISVDKAISDSKVAIASATTAEAKSAAIAARKNAIANASAIRDAAIAALGALPMKPSAPTKPVRPEHVAHAPKIPNAVPSAVPTA